MAASFLKIGGDKVEDAILDLVTVAHELNRHSTCEVECRQTADKRFPIEDRLGQDLQIFTYDQNGTEKLVFDGFVLEGELEYEVFGSYRARLRAVSRSYKLDVTPQERYFRQAKLEDVAKQLCGDDELESKVSCPALDPKNYVQWGETDWSLLLRIADQHKAYILPTPGGIEIRDSFETGVSVQWRLDDAQGLTSFSVQGGLKPASITGTHYEAAAMKSVKLEAVKKEPEWFSGAARMASAVSKQSAGKLPWSYESEDARARDEGEYRALLERMAERNLGSAVVCHGASRHEGVQAGRTVKVEGVLDAAGEYGVVKVIHRWGKLGYENEFWCTPWKRWMEGEAPRAPRMAGVVVARVVEHNDPKKMGRVQVSYDWQEGGATGWARMAVPHAGADRGFMFMPEVGDEVLVAFEQGDVERPYIVGSLWNGVDTAPRDEFWGGELADNDIKRIVTKSGHRIQLVDKPGKEAISIATPNHTRITMYEKAEETGRPAIVVHNETGDIVFTAPQGRIHFQSKYFSREIGIEGGEQKAAQPAAKPEQEQAAPKTKTVKKAAQGTKGFVAPVGAGGPAAQRQQAALKEAAKCGKPLVEVCR